MFFCMPLSISLSPLIRSEKKTSLMSSNGWAKKIFIRKKKSNKIACTIFHWILWWNELCQGTKKSIKEGKINLNYKRAVHQFSLASNFNAFFFSQQFLLNFSCDFWNCSTFYVQAISISHLSSLNSTLKIH